jgi:hypothetical protein
MTADEKEELKYLRMEVASLRMEVASLRTSLNTHIHQPAPLAIPNTPWNPTPGWPVPPYTVTC